MFRCPKCAQSRRMELKLPNEEKATLRNSKDLKEMKMFIVAGDDDFIGVEVAEDHPQRKEYEQLLMQVDREQIICCFSCQIEEKLNEFILAFSNPMDYFEADNLCRCGGEFWMDNIPGTKDYGFVCEKCNYVKPKEKVSGGE